MKNNIIIAFFVITSALPMLGMHNTELDERMPRMITKFKKPHRDPNYKIPNEKEHLLTLHTEGLIFSHHIILSRVEAALAKYGDEKKLVNDHFSSIDGQSNFNKKPIFNSRSSIVLNRSIS